MPVSPQERLLSLDVFRGVTIAGMILVNNPGSWSHVYAPLRHAEWFGWTPTDLVFPFFLFIVGVALTYSLGKVMQTGVKPAGLYWKIVRRTLILFGLGLFLHLIPANFPPGYNWFTDTLLRVRIMGVLQRIALVYCLTALLVVHFRPRAQVWWAVGLLAFYWVVMKLVPFAVVVNGAAVTHVGTLDKEINLAAYLDNMLLHGHTWEVGKFLHRDPEGLLSTIPAVVTCLLGVFTGAWLKQGRPAYETVSGLFVAGISGLLLGSVMAVGFPLCKPLWSPSYVVFTGGMALVFLAMCYYLIEIKHHRSWIKPFVIFGVNPIALYVLAETGSRLLILIKVSAGHSLQGWLHERLFLSWLSDINASLAYALCYVLFWLGVMSILYYKRIFIKI